MESGEEPEHCEAWPQRQPQCDSGSEACGIGRKSYVVIRGLKVLSDHLAQLLWIILVVADFAHEDSNFVNDYHPAVHRVDYAYDDVTKDPHHEFNRVGVVG